MATHTPYACIGQIAPEIRESRLSPADVVGAAVLRIDTLNPRLNAFITVLRDEARDAARQAEREIRSGEWRGPLHGIPLAVKDFYDTAGIRTTAASERFKDRTPREDAAAVAALKRAGAIVIGKTNMHQLGMGTTGLDSFFGAVRNPWNDAFIPGGSSSGSAAAVAAGLCYATVDTDAVGSCRLPAACCGVVGFKATYDAISTRGILGGEPVDEAIRWLAHPAITARCVDDAAVVFAAVADAAARSVQGVGSASARARLRIGVSNGSTNDADVLTEFTAAVDALRACGHDIVAVAAPFEMPRFGDWRSIERDRERVADRHFTDIDVVVLPTLATTVPTVQASANPQALSPGNTMFANYFGLPAISVPCGFDARGLPIGLQVVGRPWDEATVLGVAREYEGATVWSAAHPLP